jgi:hypothetical protein
MKSSCYLVFSHSVLLCPNLYSINLHNSLKYAPFSFLDSQLLNPPKLSLAQVKVKVTLRLTVSQSVSQSWCQDHSGAHDQIFITVRLLRFCYGGAPSLTRGRVFLLSESSLKSKSKLKSESSLKSKSKSHCD